MWKGLIVIIFLSIGGAVNGQGLVPANVGVNATSIFAITDVVINPTAPTQDQYVDITVAYENIGNLIVIAKPQVNITNASGDVIAEIMFIDFLVVLGEKNNITNFSAWYTNANPIACYNASAQAQYQGTDNITKVTSVVIKSFCIGPKPPPPPPSAGGGGVPETLAPAPTRPPEPCIKERVNVLGPELTRCILDERKLRYETFYVLPNTIAASAAVGGKYSVPSDPLVSAGLANSLEIKPVSIYEEAASQVLQKFKQSKMLLLARGDLPVDSMAAVAFARLEKIPILLTEPKGLPEATLNAIALLGPAKVIVVGGEVAVSKSVEVELSKNWQVERVWGETRYETAVELASMVKDPEIVVVTDGSIPSVDAILVSAEYRAPLLYVNGEFVPHAVRKYLLEHRETSTGKELKLVAVGVNKKALIEMQGLVTLPKFLVGIEAFSRLYQVIMGLIS